MKQPHPIRIRTPRRRLHLRTWLLVAVAAVACVVLALLFARPIRQDVKGLVDAARVPVNQVELRHSLLNNVYPTISQTAVVMGGPLRVSGENARYFADGSGKVVYLTGSHTWSNLQDNGGGYPPPVFDYKQYLDFLVANGHNFFRLWRWEQARWTLETADGNYWFEPLGPWVRSGPGDALDGKPKWDLSRFEQGYFDRLRARVVAAQEKGIYVAVMLFDGWSVSGDKGGFNRNNPWRGHPMHKENNINGVNGDTNNNESGEETHELRDAAVLEYQKAYVRKVVDTLNDLDNVLWEISNESHMDATAWQNTLVDYIHAYEGGKAKQHPVGMTAEWPNGSDAELWASNADWISPSGDVYKSNPPAGDGRAVVIVDTDHLWGIGGDAGWVWKSFTRGLNPIFMDGYDGAGYGVGGAGFNFNDPTWVKLRANMGYSNSYAQRMQLAKMKPSGELCSTGYCLANVVEGSGEYLVYQPASGPFSVDLSGLSGSLAVEWLNPADGSQRSGASAAGGGVVNFTPPFSGDAVLYLVQAGVTATAAPPTATATAVLPTATAVPPTATATPVPTPTAAVLFPTSPVLDNFNRPDGHIGVNWGDRPVEFRIVNRRLRAPVAGAGVWQPSPFGSNQEVYVTLAQIDPAAQELGVLLKVQDAGGGQSRAIKAVYLPSASVLRVAVFDVSGDWQPRTPDIPVAFVSGDRLGAQAYADGTVALFRNERLLGSVDAGAQTATWSGNIGFVASGPQSSGGSDFDNFGGGDVTTNPPPPYTPTVTTSVVGQGSISVTPSGAIACGQPVTITAVPAAKWQFIGWTGDILESDNPLAYELTGSLVLIANFAEEVQGSQYDVASTVVGKGKVNVRPSGPYLSGQVVELTGVAEPGWRFDAWGGSVASRDNPLRFQIRENLAVTANFEAVTPLFMPFVNHGSASTLQVAQENCE